MAEAPPLVISGGQIQVLGSADDLAANAFVQKSTAKYENVWIPSSAVRLHESSPPGEITIWGGTYRTLAFDPNIEESVYIESLIPRAYIEGQAIRVCVHWFPADNGSGVCRWKLDYRKANVNEVFSSTVTVTMNSSTTSTTDKHYRTADVFITGSSMEREQAIVGRLYRDATSGVDTYANDAYLIGLSFRVPVNRIGASV